MIIETAMVFDVEGQVIHWHQPVGCTSCRIPDSRELWDILWEHRMVLGGLAHTHPGTGMQWPSKTDITTFAAVEAGLGKRLVWPIVGETRLDFYSYNKAQGNYEPNHNAYWEYGKKPGWNRNIQSLLHKTRGSDYG